MENQMDAVFKEAILEKRTKVYSDITSFYFEKIQEMQPKLFLAWLTTKLNLPADAIKYKSFIMAMYRHNKRRKLIIGAKTTQLEESIKNENQTQISRFNMPDPTSREYIDKQKKNKEPTFKPL
jgi:hypothetical protein